jgi:heptosyltransferase I
MTLACPRSLCVLRLSALGDICQILPAVRSFQSHCPKTRLTWIIGKNEFPLFADIPDIEFIVFDKKSGWSAVWRLWQQLRGRQFDVLWHMQSAFRASVLSLGVSAKIRVGFDRARAADLQGWFTNTCIPARECEHMVDAFFSFAEMFQGVDKQLRWDIPVTDDAREFAQDHCSGKTTLLLNPCATAVFPWRNWQAERYAEVADYAVAVLGWQVIMIGGPSVYEQTMGQKVITAMQETVTNLIGLTSLKQLLALIARADAVLSPDSGPIHLANAVGTPVIGLYAATNPDLTGPYVGREWVVNAWPQAIQQQFGDRDVPWTQRIRNEEAMRLIDSQSVIGKLQVLADCVK